MAPDVTRYTEAGPRDAGTVMTVEWEPEGQRFVGINGGPECRFDEAVSFRSERSPDRAMEEDPGPTGQSELPYSREGPELASPSKHGSNGC